MTKGVLTNLKVRYSYGVVGNDKGATRFNYIQKFEQLSANAQFGKYQTSNWGPLYKEGKLADPDATWEESIKQNIGIEIGLWGKLNFTVDLFDEKRNNILMTRNTIPSWADSGIAFPQVNLGKTKITVLNWILLGTTVLESLIITRSLILQPVRTVLSLLMTRRIRANI